MQLLCDHGASWLDQSSEIKINLDHWSFSEWILVEINYLLLIDRSALNAWSYSRLVLDDSDQSRSQWLIWICIFLASFLIDILELYLDLINGILIMISILLVMDHNL
jgi:hypothetical protein